MDWKRRLRLGALTVIPIIPVALLWAPLHRPDADRAPVRLVVSLSDRELRVIENGDVVRSYGVAVGRPSHPTPTGRFRTGDIDWNPSWTPPPQRWARNRHYEEPGAATNPMQGVKIYFLEPYYFIHGTNSPGSIGEAASHGCIRMTEEDAVSLAHLIQDSGGSVPLTITE
jgi:lipoprotein-anchoring transpeptidase ErfK/SrfK